MRINREMFREYDIRGVADQDLTTESSFWYCQSFWQIRKGTWLLRNVRGS